MPSSSYLSTSSVDQRIRALKKAIQKATEEALQRTNPAMMLQDSENNPNASFHLGMELFGSAEPAKMERAIQEQLVELEQQVQRLRLLSVEQQHEQQHDGPDEVVMMEPRRMIQGEAMTVPRVAISLDASVLQFKVQFLKQCSQVRQLIDESIAWSDPSYSSSCTDPTETSSSSMTMMTGTGGEVDMIQAMSKLLEAEMVWEQTHESLMDFRRKQQQQQEEPREDGQSNNNNSSNNNSKSTEQEQELQSCRDMMEWLRQDIRNPKVELMCHIQTLWNACVTLESETLFVRGFDRPLKSSASSHSNPTTMMTTTTSPPRPPLEQVYGVLQVLTEQQQGQQQQQQHGHSLQKELLLPFATRLYEQVLRPVLDGHENKKTNNNKSQRQRPVKWIFHESQERGTSSALLSSSSSSSSALMTQLGPVKSLEWTRENNDQEEDEDNNTLERKEEEEEDVVAAWKETLEFVQYILVFVADHVLLGRSDLCQLLGQRLLGRPKAQVATGVNNRNKNNQKNNNELLGLTMTTSNAFQLIGKDDGILMEPLVDLMMDTCLPDFVSPNKKKKKKKQTDEESVDCGCDLVQELRHVQSRLQTIVLPFLETLQTHGLLHESSSTTTTATMTNVMQDLATTTTTTTETTNSSNNESCRLYEFVQHFMAHYIHHRHSLLLDEARTLILQEKDFHNTQSVGVDPMTITSEEDRRLGLDPGLDLFVLHQSCVSETALSLHQLCVACMDEAVDTAVALAVQANATTTTGRPDMALDDLPATLYQTARQVLDLYRAIVPVRYGKEIAQVPRTAAIFYSDCVFLAHHCHSLGLLYRDKFPEGTSSSASSNNNSINSDLRRVCIFVDKVPLFRDMADRCMKEMLDRQSHQIQELVHPRIPLLSKALRSTEIVAEWADAETALNAALYHLQHLAQQWKPVLAQRMFHSTLGYLAHVLFTLFLEPVLAAPDLSTDACEFVHDLFGKALDRVQTLLQVSSSASQSSTGAGAASFSSSWNGNKEEEDDGVVAMVPTWNRFKAVGQFMDMTLNDVEVALSQGVFASVTGQELSRLLMAAHDESPRRQELLKLIKQQ